MRIRSIRPEFFQDKVTGSLSNELQIFLIGLWCHADSGGYFEGDPDAIGALVFPRKRFSKSRVNAMLRKLVELRVIQRMQCSYSFYTNDEEVRYDYLYRVIGFNSMQHIHHKEKPKFKVIKIIEHNAAYDQGQHGADPVVSGSLSLAPGLREPVSGSLSPVARNDARGDSPPVAPDGAPSGRASTSGSEEAKNPPIADTPPPADEPPPWTGPAEIRPGETWGQAVARELREGK